MTAARKSQRKQACAKNAKLKGCMTEQGEITITKEEAALVIALLKMWDAAADDRNHKLGCDCSFCEAFEKAGDFDARTFKSLEEKVNE